MENVTAVISMLHEPVVPNSATRLFRQQAVLGWTLQRLGLAKNVESAAILCWEDQLEHVAALAGEHDTHVLAKGPRMPIPAIESVAAARRWADGWRGGPLFTCDFDLGFYGQWVKEIVEKLGSDAVIMIDPSAGLVDPKLVDNIIEHARTRENVELVFTQAAPGLGGVLLRPAMVDRLAAANTHPGRILHYLPEQPMRDPISGESCYPVPTPVARTTRSFRLDSDRQITRLTEAAISLNGELVKSDSEELLNRLAWTGDFDSLPREIVLEINTNRATSPIFWPGQFARIERAAMSLDVAKRIFAEIGDEVRVTLAGVGDPMMHDGLFEIIDAAKRSGVAALHVQTDLLPDDEEFVTRLAESEIDVVSVNLPAMTPRTYATVMGVDQFGRVIENIRRFITRRHERSRGVPILIPQFAKCQANLAEMETWYDQWLKALGAAVILGPSDCAGLVPDCAVADMAPPLRRACNRLWSRMTILSDGRVVSCEQDVTAKQVVGDVKSQSVRLIWRDGLRDMRSAHKSGCWNSKPTCAGCREWHRP